MFKTNDNCCSTVQALHRIRQDMKILSALHQLRLIKLHTIPLIRWMGQRHHTATDSIYSQSSAKHQHSKQNLCFYSESVPCRSQQYPQLQLQSNHILSSTWAGSTLERRKSESHYFHTSQPACKHDVNKLTFPFKSIVQATPDAYKPYTKLMRLHQPIGIWLLFLPSAWSLSLATSAGSLPDATLMFKFFVGSVLMRGAGCTINDMMDIKFDKKVTRTKDRPLAAGLLTKEQATKCLTVQLAAALAILLTFDSHSILLGAMSVLPTMAYPLMKRYTYWPQLFLGLTFNWGVLMGWSVVHQGMMDWSVVLPLYTAGIMWTMIYDTIYAHQDRVDDLLIGVKSLAIHFGDNTRAWLYGFLVVMLAGLLLAGINSDQTFPYYIGSCLMCARLMQMISKTRLNMSSDCARAFIHSQYLGILMLIAIVISTKLKQKSGNEEY